MPKLKTNKTAAKRFRARASGLKRAQAYTSHNTAKKSAKRIRQLRASKLVDKTNWNSIKGMLPYGSIN